MEEFDHLKISLEDIISATDNFAPNKRIGRGGFGYVYKGELSRPDGRINVACKRLDRRYGQGDAEFFKEIHMLSKCLHKNLVPLLHFCIENDERIIVYEYVSRGSLDNYLSDVSLTWTQRLKICIGVAKALNYLHDPADTQHRIIHRDIKSSNILLDEEWNAKVSDFGLSKFGPANLPQTYLFTNIVGTPGYADPLYLENYILTKESDVYSFGVVLFEVMCGTLCYEHRDGRLRILVPKWRKCFEENRLDEIINHGLRIQMEPGSLDTFSTIAYQCLIKAREARPTMGEIVQKLEVALEQQEVIDSIVKRMNFEEMRRIAYLAVPPLFYESQTHLLLLFMKGVSVDNGNTWFSVNMRGQHYEFISASSCVLANDTNWLLDINHLEPTANFVSRFPYLVEYKSNQDLRLKVMSQCLSLNVKYVVNLVYKCDSPHNYGLRIPLNYKLDEVVGYLTSSGSGSHVGEDRWLIDFKYNMKKLRQCSTSRVAYVGEDGWLRTELFHFTSTYNQHYFDIRFSSETASPWIDEGYIYYLFIEGVEFCPVGFGEDENKADMLLKTDIDVDQGEKLPDDYTEIVKDIDKRMNRKEAYILLRKGVYIEDSQHWFSISKKAEKRLMLPAELILQEEKSKSRWNLLAGRISWIWKSLSGSRFDKVAEICDINHIPITLIFKSHLLSTGILYACYLIFRLPEKAFVFANAMVTCFDILPTRMSMGSRREHHIYLVTPPHAPNIILRPCDERLLRTRKIKGHPKLRKDGWMETQLYEFQVDSHEDEHIRIVGYLRSWDFTGLLVQGVEVRPAKVS